MGTALQFISGKCFLEFSVITWKNQRRQCVAGLDDLQVPSKWTILVCSIITERGLIFNTEEEVVFRRFENLSSCKATTCPPIPKSCRLNLWLINESSVEIIGEFCTFRSCKSSQDSLSPKGPSCYWKNTNIVKSKTFALRQTWKKRY